MRHLTIATLLAAGLLTGPFVAPATAVTIEELFSLKANGLSDDILVALIASDGSVFRLVPEDVVTLYRRGLSERVILAMIGTSRGRPQPPAEMVTPVPGQQTIVQPVQVVNSAPVEVYVPVEVPVTVFVPVINPPELEKRDKPVYWGFGGQLRPDAWRPAPDTDRKPDTPAPTPPARRR
jgi:hypothetical protein